MKVIVIGAGIIGAAIAQDLARHGARVTVIDANSAPGLGASGASFGWINASFFLNDDHFVLREQGLAAWRAIGADLNLAPLNWAGALWWEEQGAGMDAMEAGLRAKGYAVERLTGRALAPLVPGLKNPPPEALLMRAEGVAEADSASRALLTNASENSARCLFGTRVTGIGPGRVETAAGHFQADQVVIAAGCGSEALMKMAGHALPMLDRPGVLVRTAPVNHVSDFILVTPEGEARQDASGRMILPGAVSHQGDETDRLTMPPDAIADETIARWRPYLKDGEAMRWTEASLAWRPVPKDGLPVIGEVESGLYVAAMHSGVTLAAIVGQLVSAELRGHAHELAPLLTPFCPGRFTL